MKKPAFIIFVLILSSYISAFAQEKTVKGEYKGTTVTIKYVPGDPDYIKKIDYVDKLIEDLNKSSAKVQSLQKKMKSLADSVNSLHKKREDSLVARIRILEKGVPVVAAGPSASKVKTLTDSIVRSHKGIEDSLKARIKTLETATVPVPVPVSANKTNEELTYLRNRNFSLYDSLQEANKTIKHLKSLPLEGQRMADRSGLAIVLSYSLGMPLFSNDLIKNDLWNKTRAMSRNEVSIAAEIPIKTSPFAIEAGLGITSSKLKAGFSQYQETVNGQVDPFGVSYNAICSYKNVEEQVTLFSVNLGPLGVSYGRPRSNRVSGYGKLGVTFSYNLQKNFKGAGMYDISGYYPEWDVTIHDVPELNFTSDGSCYDKVEMSANQFILWGNIAGGIYIPLSKIRDYREAHLVLKIGARCDYTLTAVSKQLDETFIKGAAYRINQCNILAGKGTYILSPGIEIGLAYLLLNK
jgi:hypothetical protein